MLAPEIVEMCKYFAAENHPHVYRAAELYWNVYLSGDKPLEVRELSYFYSSPFNVPLTCQYRNCKSTQTSRGALSGADLHGFHWSNVDCYELVLSEAKMKI